MLMAHELGMTDGEYVYVVADQVPRPNVFTPWVAGDDRDETAKRAFESVLQVCVLSRVQSGIKSKPLLSYQKIVLNRTKEIRFLRLKYRSSTLILCVGNKYSVRDLLCNVSNPQSSNMHHIR